MTTYEAIPEIQKQALEAYEGVMVKLHGFLTPAPTRDNRPDSRSNYHNFRHGRPWFHLDKMLGHPLVSPRLPRLYRQITLCAELSLNEPTAAADRIKTSNLSKGHLINAKSPGITELFSWPLTCFLFNAHTMLRCDQSSNKKLLATMSNLRIFGASKGKHKVRIN